MNKKFLLIFLIINLVLISVFAQQIDTIKGTENWVDNKKFNSNNDQTSEVDAFGAKGAKGTNSLDSDPSSANNINNWPQKAQDMCKKAQDNAIQACRESAYSPGGWWVDRTISAEGTYQGKIINTLIDDLIVGQWDCPPHELLVDENGNYIEQAKIYSELIDYSNMMNKQEGGKPADEQNIEITCKFSCSAWPCPLHNTPKQNSNCIDTSFSDKNKDGKDDRTGRTKKESTDRIINGKPSKEGGEYFGLKLLCEGESISWWQFWKRPDCKLSNCEKKEIKVGADTSVLRVCCDCSCGTYKVDPSFDPRDYTPLSYDPFKKVFDSTTPSKVEQPTVLTTAPQPKEQLPEMIPIFCNTVKPRGKSLVMAYSFMKGTRLYQKEAPGEPFCDQITDELGNVFSVVITPVCQDKTANLNVIQCDKFGCRNGKCLGQPMPEVVTDERVHNEQVASHPCCVLFTAVEKKARVTDKTKKTGESYYIPKSNAVALDVTGGNCGGTEGIEGEKNGVKGKYITYNLPSCELSHFKTSTTSTTSSTSGTSTPTGTASVHCSDTFSNARISFWSGSGGASSSPTGTDTYVMLSYDGPNYDKYPDQIPLTWHVQGKTFSYTQADSASNNGWTPQQGFRMMTVKLNGLQPGNALLELKSNGDLCKNKLITIPGTPVATSTPALMKVNILSTEQFVEGTWSSNIQPGNPLHIVVNVDNPNILNNAKITYILNDNPVTFDAISVNSGGPGRFSHAAAGNARAGDNYLQIIIKDLQGNILVDELKTFQVSSTKSPITSLVISNIPDGKIIDMFGRITGMIVTENVFNDCPIRVVQS